MQRVLRTSYAPDSAGWPLGRDEQAAALRQLLGGCLGARTGGAAYVSGLPGTGAPSRVRLPMTCIAHLYFWVDHMAHVMICTGTVRSRCRTAVQAQSFSIMALVMRCVIAAGKTLTVHAVARACCQAAEACSGNTPAPALLSLSCMSLAAPGAVFRRILDAAACSGSAPGASGRRATLGGPSAPFYSCIHFTNLLSLA